jgi:GNAT superfamily N-acetyltransferase/N-acetylglutamate synthase-like GNAT family acetyltransferase
LQETLIRNADSDEVKTLPKLLQEWTSGFVEATGAEHYLGSKAFDQAGCFIAEKNSELVGCVAVTNLPKKNWHVLRYLTANHPNSRPEVVERLLGRALEFTETRKPEFLRATTPSIQPYVDIYKRSGFKPLRRDFRITWDLTQIRNSTTTDVAVNEVTDRTAVEMSKVFVESLHPYWDWRTEEEGGEDAVARNFIEGRMKGERWLYANNGTRTVALFGLIPDYYSPGEARFRGAFVVQDQRGKGYGAMMMNAGLDWAKKLGQRKMTVYTFSYLDCLAPGALLYVKSGGKIESEYLQLQRAV